MNRHKFVRTLTVAVMAALAVWLVGMFVWGGFYSFWPAETPRDSVFSEGTPTRYAMMLAFAATCFYRWMIDD